MEIKPGIYRHFKGNEYQVIGTAKDSETLEEVVIYKALYGKEETWIRPLKNFQEGIERENYRGPRFKFIKEV